LNSLNFLDKIVIPIQTANGLRSLISDPEDLTKVSTISSFGGAGIPAEQDTANYLNTYRTISYIYRAVNIIAQSVSQLPIVIERKVGDEWVDMSDSPDFEIFKAYNEFQTKEQFWQAAIILLELTGESPWILQRSAGGKIEAMYPIASSFLNVFPANDFQVSHYEFVSGSGTRIRLDGDDIFFMKFYNPTNPVRGLSPLSAAKEDIVLDLDATATSQAIFKQGVRPSAVFSSEDAINDKFWNRLKQELRTEYAGVNNSGKPIMLDHGMKFQKLAMNNKELMGLEYSQKTKDTIMEVYGVPPILMSQFKEASVLANADVQLRLFWESTITSLTTLLNGIFTERLIPQITNQKDVRFRFNLSGIIALQPDMDSLGKRYQDGAKIGAVSPNDYREDILQKPRIDDPAMDQYYLPLNVIPVGEEVDGGSSEPGTKALLDFSNAIESLKDGITPAEIGANIDRTMDNFFIEQGRAAANGSIQRIVIKIGGRFQKKLVKLFTAQEQEVLRNLRANKGYRLQSIMEKEFGLKIGFREEGFKTWIHDDYDVHGDQGSFQVIKYSVDGVMFDLDEWNAAFMKAGQEDIADAFYIAAGELSDDLNDTFAESARSEEWLGQRTTEYASMVNGTTADRINSLVAQGLADGLTVDQMADRIEKYFENNKRMRALRIARTEMVTAGNSGRNESMLQSKKVAKKMWLSARDGDVRTTAGDDHVTMDGTVVGKDESFTGHEGMYADFPSSPNERCFVIPRLVTKKPKKS
jgi:HK97 family phage portal protein